MNLRPIFTIAAIATLVTSATLCLRPFLAGVTAKQKVGAERLLVPAMVRSLRPTYPYSIIPGGVYSRRELLAQLQRDSVARDHYADFNLETAHLTASDRDHLAYVSYRQHGQVFWTRNKLRIPKGELLITDGQHSARTRCGNRIADRRPATAQSSRTEPVAELQMPTVSEDKLADERVTFSPPPPAETQLAETVAKPLGWEPLVFPFSWAPRIEILSATAPSQQVSSVLSAPFGLPNVGAPFFPLSQATPGTTPIAGGGTPVSGSTGIENTPTAQGPGSFGGIPVQVVPMAPVPEPNYAPLFATALLLGVGLLRWRARG